MGRLSFLLLAVCLACSKPRPSIDFSELQKMIPVLTSLSFKEIYVRQDGLLLDDFLMLSIDSSGHQKIVSDSVYFSGKESFSRIHYLLVKNGINRLYFDNDAYFFVYGGWIDAQWGLAYSERSLIGKESVFTFDRIQEFEVIEEDFNWYYFYAD